MSTSVQGSVMIDAATLGAAAVRMEDEINAPLQSNGSTAQDMFVWWLRQNRSALNGLDVRVKSSGDHNVLNEFLTAANYEPMFAPIPPNCHGVATILDMLVKWQNGADITTVESMVGSGKRPFKAFDVPTEGARIFQVEGQMELLVQLLTTHGSSVWLIKTPRPQSELDLLEFATRIMGSARVEYPDQYTSVTVPMVSIERPVSLEWLLGASFGPEVIDQAFQVLSVSLDETGGHAKAMTGLATRECVMDELPLVFDQPFTLWFTQGSSELPIASVYADYDVWKPQI